MPASPNVRVVSLLEALPALGESLPPEEFARARALLHAEVVSLRRGLGQRDQIGSTERYGRATPEGITLPIRLGHLDLAELIGTQRPSVSAHLARLSARGEVLRRPDRTWLLVGPPRAEIDDLRTRA